jgi:hypothetical protein
MVNEKTYHLPFAFGKGTPPSKKEENFPTRYFSQNFPSFWKEGCPQGGVVGLFIENN